MKDVGGSCLGFSEQETRLAGGESRQPEMATGSSAACRSLPGSFGTSGLHTSEQR